MLLTEKVKVKIINFNVDMYNEKGYTCKIGDEIDVNVWDVSIHSHLRVELLCDQCNISKKDISIDSLNKRQEYKEGNYICNDCKKKIAKERKCDVCGSNNGVTLYHGERFLCKKHQRQLYDKGEIKRTIKDKNEIRIFNDYAEFDTYNIKGEVNGTYKIDLDIVDFIKNNKIHRHKDKYACYKFQDENGKTKNMRLHRYIMNVHNKSRLIEIDHLYKDRSDNRREFLRIVNHDKNAKNQSLMNTNTSGHKGISFDKRCEKWEAYIHKNNKKISLGRYKDYNRAVKVREIAEIIYFGEWSSDFDDLVKKHIGEKEVQEYLIKNKINKIESEK